MSTTTTELAVQRRTTGVVIDIDPFMCVLTREERVPDGSGGYTTQKTPQAAQKMRLMALAPGAGERQTTQGRSVVPQYAILGRHDANVKRFDTFTRNGLRYEVVFVSEDRRWETRAEVIYVGE